MKQKLEMVTTMDQHRLISLLDSKVNLDSTLSLLDDKLASAAIIEPSSAPSDLITMNSTLLALMVDGPNDGSNQEGPRKLTLVYPREANLTDGRISVFTPLGTKLLGVRAGDLVTWTGRDDIARQMMIDKIVYQPEASGDWHL